MLSLNEVLSNTKPTNVVNIKVTPPQCVYSINDFAHLETSSKGTKKVDSVIDLHDRDKDLLTFIYLDNNRRDLVELMPISATQTQMIWLLRRLYGIGLTDACPDVPLGSNDVSTASVILTMVAESYQKHGEEVQEIRDLLDTSTPETLSNNFREMLYLDCESRLEDALDSSLGSFKNYMEFDHVED